jgi:hypothetical protein
MKKITLLVAFSLVVLSASAQIFIENFATATVGANVEGYNSWIVSPKSSDNLGKSPIIGAGALTYTGYASSGIGKVAILDSINGSASSTQRITTHYATYGNDTMKVAIGEKLYVAFLAKFSLESKTNTVRDFFTFEASKTSSMTRGRLFTKIAKTGNFVLAISKNSTSSSILVESDSLSVNDTHLIVMVYESIEGADNDNVIVYYNPDLSKSENQQTKKIALKTNATGMAETAVSDYSNTAGLAFNLRQRGIGAQIGGIRAAKNWTDALLTVSAVKQVNYNATKIFANGKNIITTEAGTLNVFNLTGAKILSTQTEGNFATSINKGLYLVKFESANGNISSAKIEIK